MRSWEPIQGQAPGLTLVGAKKAAKPAKVRRKAQRTVRRKVRVCRRKKIRVRVRGYRTRKLRTVLVCSRRLARVSIKRKAKKRR